MHNTRTLPQIIDDHCPSLVEISVPTGVPTPTNGKTYKEGSTSSQANVCISIREPEAWVQQWGTKKIKEKDITIFMCSPRSTYLLDIHK